MTTTATYCSCETPVMDVEHDAGCRRCGLPVDFSPRSVYPLETGEMGSPGDVRRMRDHARDCPAWSGGVCRCRNITPDEIAEAEQAIGFEEWNR